MHRLDTAYHILGVFLQSREFGVEHHILFEFVVHDRSQGENDERQENIEAQKLDETPLFT